MTTFLWVMAALILGATAVNIAVLAGFWLDDGDADLTDAEYAKRVEELISKQR